MLEQQVGACSPIRARRRSSTNFAASGCKLRNLRARDARSATSFPEFDENLREAFQQETELFLESQLREDRSVLELLTANYTFVNERLARHYGIPDVYGSHFRRVTLAGRAPRRAARPGQHPDGHVVPEPHVAGAARQVAAREHARERRRRRRRPTCRR